MKKLLLSLLGVVAVSALIFSVACAGLEPNAQGKLQWYNDATCVVHAGVYYPATEPQGFDAPTMLVSATGLSAFRGADVQLVIQGISNGMTVAQVPASWQAQSGGCAQSRLTITMGPGFANCYPSAWNNIYTLVTAQEGMYYNYSTCVTPIGIGLFWLQSAGAAGSNPPLDPNVEYGLYSITVAQTNTPTSTCSGNSTHGASPVAIYPYYRLPCQDVAHGYVFAALDANNDIDYVPFATTSWAPWVSYNAPLACIVCDKVRSTTWGELRRMYH